MVEPKLETLKDLKSRDYSTNEGDRGLVNAVFFDLRQLAIKWIKRDIENSSDFITGDSIELPNGKLCRCDAVKSCRFHREGQRLIEIFNIEESELRD